MRILEHAETHFLFPARTLWLPSSLLRMELMLIKKRSNIFFLIQCFTFSFMVHILSSSIFTRTRLSYFFLVNHSFNSFKLCAHWKSCFDCSPYLGQHQGVMQLKLKWCILGWPWNLSHGRWLVVGAKQTQIRIPDGCKLHSAPKLSGIRQGE